MKHRTMLSRCLALALSFAFAAAGVFAQSTDTAGGSGHAGASAAPSPHITVTDHELKQFATALQDVHTVQVGFQKGFQKALSDSPLSKKRFVQIYRSEQAKHAYPSDASGREKQSYQTLLREVVDMEKRAQHDMAAVIEKDGMKIPRFNQIVHAVHTDPALAQRLKQVEE